jgi:hypothetical protein
LRIGITTASFSLLRAGHRHEQAVRTRLSICQKKRRFASAQDALLAIAATDIVLRHYRCDRCGAFHLTGRTKGKRVARIGS